MNILIADDAHTFGGAQIAAVNLARYLGETLGHEVTFLCPAANAQLADKLRQVPRVAIMTDGPLAAPLNILAHLLSLWRVGGLARRLKRLGPDVVLVNMGGLEFGWLTIHAARLAGMRTICWLHNPTRFDELAPRQGWRRIPGLVRDRCADQFARLIFGQLYTVSNAARVYLLTRLGRQTGIGILGNVVYAKALAGPAGDDPFPVLLGGFAARRIALVPGRISFGDKGQDRLVPCLAALERRAIAVVFVGDGADLATLQAACAGHRNVFFTGWQEDVERYLRHADVALLPSRFEAQPLIAMEAMAMATPIVTSPIAPFIELAGARYATEFADGEALCEKIEEVCTIEKEQLMSDYRERMALFSGPAYQRQVERVVAGSVA